MLPGPVSAFEKLQPFLFSVALLAMSAPGPSWANNGGIPGFTGDPADNGGIDCVQCHAGGLAPQVSLSGPTVLGGGETGTYELRVAGGQSLACGFSTTATEGALAAVELGTQLWAGHVTHTLPRLVDPSGECRFAFDWTAPYTDATVELYAAGNSVDLDQTTAGDLATSASLTVTVVGVPVGQIPPMADPGGPYAATVGVPVVFDGTGSSDPDGAIVLYAWGLGEGGLDFGSQPTHTYASPGVYDIVLTVIDDTQRTDTVQTTITVFDQRPALRATRVISSSSLTSQLWVTAPAGDERLFVVRRFDSSGMGRIYVIDENGQLLASPFLEIPVGTTGQERSIRGMAFAPDYATSGTFYVLYSPPGLMATRVSRFQVDPNDPNLALAASEEVILDAPQPALGGHNGSHLEFGPDGMLYIGYGDGSDAAQARQDDNLLGKIIRIDVSGAGPGYGIPLDNPFIGSGSVLDEIFLRGFRNPYRFSFDRATGDLFIADVGGAQREEVDYVAAGTSGQHFGWSFMEGSVCHTTPSTCTNGTLTPPLYEYPHAPACAISAAVAYQGVIPGFRGKAFFADYCSDEIWSLRADAQGNMVDFTDHTAEIVPDVGSIGSIVAIARDGFGELLIVDQDGGEIFRIVSSEADDDGDFVPNSVDNCALVANRAQGDADGDGVGDACDLPCDNGIDDDGDGLIDTDDPGCPAAAWPSEAPACSDLLDNDGDNTADWNGVDLDGDGQFSGPGEFPPDPECGQAYQDTEAEPQGPIRCGLGPEVAAGLAALMALRRARRRRRA